MPSQELEKTYKRLRDKEEIYKKMNKKYIILNYFGLLMFLIPLMIFLFGLTVHIPEDIRPLLGIMLVLGIVFYLYIPIKIKKLLYFKKIFLKIYNILDNIEKIIRGDVDLELSKSLKSEI